MSSDAPQPPMSAKSRLYLAVIALLVERLGGDVLIMDEAVQEIVDGRLVLLQHDVTVDVPEVGKCRGVRLAVHDRGAPADAVDRALESIEKETGQ